MRPIGSEILLFRRYSPSVFRSPSTQNFQNNLSRPILRRKRLAAGEDASRYWITKGLATVGNHIRNCITCRMARAKATPPRMAPLPAHRLQSHIRPLTNVGIDYFGPFNTVVGRRQEKRYGALLTCFSTRAVHLELAHYLTSDSFILAFRRFVNRRGAPPVVYSDNGTNCCA